MTCKECIHSGVCYKENDYDNFPDRCGEFISDKILEEKIIELFNKYNVLLVHLDGKIVPVRNTTKQECYDLLYDIQELIEWRKLLFKKEYTVENLQRNEGDLSGK